LRKRGVPFPGIVHCYIPVPVNEMLMVAAVGSFVVSTKVAVLLPVELGLNVIPRL
jgi:hypothetical protein